MIAETLELLWTWTPFLLQGLYWNIVIAMIATALGTLVGSALALLLLSSSRIVAQAVGFILGEVVINIPDWLKASIALAGSPIGFTALNLHASILHWRDGRRRAATLFIPNWLGGFLITVIASSTASLVGVNELVGRCNTVINATGTTFLFPIYVYALSMFFAFCYPVSLLLGRFRLAMINRYS
jgi:polar amino acid transport system permease protein